MKISKLKLTNSKLKSSKVITEYLKFKNALKISKVGVWDWNILTNKVFYSKESRQLLGYSKNEFKNTPAIWDTKVHPDDKEIYFRDFKAHLNGKIDVYENEYRIQCKDGSYKWVLDKGKVIERDDDGKPLRIIGTHTDITNLKQKEEQLHKNLQLITNQNKRLYSFTNIVSHHLKTDVNDLRRILKSYEDSISEIEKKEAITQLQSVSNALSTTIEDLDDIITIKSKAHTQQLNERVNLYHCSNKVIDNLKIEASDRNVTIYNALRKDEVLLTNNNYLESIFYNLISNGIKYSDPNKKAQIIIQSIHTKETVNILISDNGIGIDMDTYKEQVFEMYQTCHGTDRKNSRGIGLYITKTQVEALKGNISIESKLGEGTAFSLTLKKQKAL